MSKTLLFVQNLGLPIQGAIHILNPVDVHPELSHAIDLGVVQSRDNVRARCRVEHPCLGRHSAQRLAVVVTDVDVGTQGLDLPELI